METKKYIIIIMVLLLLVQSLITPFESQAVALTATAAAGGVTLGKALVGFVATMLAIGVTYETWQEAKNAYDLMLQNDEDVFTPPWRVSIGEIEYYMQNGEWSTGGSSLPDPEIPFSGIIQALIAGKLLLDDLSSLFGTSKDLIEHYGNNIGINTVTIGDPTRIYHNGYIVNYYWTYRSWGSPDSLYVRINSETYTIVHSDFQNSSYLVIPSALNIVDIVPYSETKVYLSWQFDFDMYKYSSGTYSTSGSREGTNLVTLGFGPLDSDPNPQLTMKYNIKPSGLTMPTKIPLPNIAPFIKPDEKEEIITPDGQKKVIFIGDFDDVVGRIADEMPIDDFYNDPNFTPYPIININGQPYPEIKPYVPPVIDPNIPPFPDPDLVPDPELPDNEQDVIPWIQVVINWISNTQKTIKDIIVPPEEYETPELDFEPLKNIVILDKFPFSLPWDMKYVISQFISEDEDTEAPLFEIDFPIEVSAVNWKQDVKFDIDFEPFTSVANIMRIMLSLIFVLGLVILTRTFIGGA